MVNLDYVLETFTKEGSQSAFTVTIIFTNYYSNPERWVMFSAQSSYHMQGATGGAKQHCLLLRSATENKAEF